MFHQSINTLPLPQNDICLDREFFNHVEFYVYRDMYRYIHSLLFSIFTLYCTSLELWGRVFWKSNITGIIGIKESMKCMEA